MSIQAILFDHDGTLVDSEIEHFRLWVEILSGYDIVLTQQQYKKFYAGLPTETNAFNLVQQFNLTVSPLELMEKKNDVTRAFLSREAFPLMPGARDTIDDFFQQGFKLGIVTGAGTEGVNATLEAHGLNSYFSSIVSKDDVVQSKPAPESYQLALKHLGLQASQAIALEDTEHGVIAAASAGINCLAIPNAMSEQHDFSLAQEIFSNMYRAREWIQSRYIDTAR